MTKQFFRFPGVPSGQPHTGVHGSVAIAANVQKARKRPEKRSERIEFQTREHTAQAGADHRDANIIRTRQIDQSARTHQLFNLCINVYIYIHIYWPLTAKSPLDNNIIYV